MLNGEPNVSERTTAAFILSLIAGLWMLSMGGMMGSFGGMMAGSATGAERFHAMRSWLWGPAMTAVGMSSGFGVAAGILVVIAAIMLYFQPRGRRGWGLMILIVSILDFLIGMGLLAGALGVIGGALAMAPGA